MSCIVLLTGWNVPLYTLLHKGLISRNSCPYTRALSEFFSGGSCVPGVLAPENNPSEDAPEKLCSICAGNLDSSGDTTLFINILYTYYPERLWGPPSLLSNGYQGALSLGVERPGRAADHSPPSSAEVKE